MVLVSFEEISFPTFLFAVFLLCYSGMLIIHFKLFYVIFPFKNKNYKLTLVGFNFNSNPSLIIHPIDGFMLLLFLKFYMVIVPLLDRIIVLLKVTICKTVKIFLEHNMIKV